VTERPLLLVDLDGVLVLERCMAGGRPGEILVLHQGLGPMFEAVRQEAMVVTHRSRREARQLVHASGLEPGHFIRIFAAEDLLIAACGGLAVRRLLSNGLEKAFALGRAEKLTGMPREAMAVIDDRQGNLDVLLEAGVGLALKAPAALSADGRSIVSFDMADVLDRLPSWHANRKAVRQIDLAPVGHEIYEWQRSGLSTQLLRKGAFNRSRRVAAALRKSHKTLFGNW
jgi:hypothetical protein